jgi:hypothetical protein
MYSKNSFKHFLFEKKIDSKLWDILHLRNVKSFWTKTISFHLSDGSRSYQLLTTKLRSGKRLKLRLNGKMQFWPPPSIFDLEIFESRTSTTLTFAKKNAQLKYTIFKNLTFVLLVFKCWLLIILSGYTLILFYFFWNYLFLFSWRPTILNLVYLCDKKHYIHIIKSFIIIL